MLTSAPYISSPDGTKRKRIEQVAGERAAEEAPPYVSSPRTRTMAPPLPGSPRTPTRFEPPAAVPGSAVWTNLSTPSAQEDATSAAPDASFCSSCIPHAAVAKHSALTAALAAAADSPERGTSTASSSATAPLPHPRSADRFVPARSGVDAAFLDGFASCLHLQGSASRAQSGSAAGEAGSGRCAAGVQYNALVSEALAPLGRRAGAGDGAATATATLQYQPERAPPRPASARLHSERAARLLSSEGGGGGGGGVPHAALRRTYLANRALLSAGGAAAAAGASRGRRGARHISGTPEKILDAPDLLDDYYLNLLSWSSRNLLAVALGRTVYLWNARSGAITQLAQTAALDDYVSSLSFSPDGTKIAVGTSSALVQLFDVGALRLEHSYEDHNRRVGSLAWNHHPGGGGGAVFSSGSRDATIVTHDARAPQRCARLRGHCSEVCGLAWSPDGRQLASGGNDNLLKIWDASCVSSAVGGLAPVGCGSGGVAAGDAEESWRLRHGHGGQSRFTLSAHCAAVRALAWCPLRRHLLASGGGTADRTIRFWNTGTGKQRNYICTQSQVCSLMWSKHEMELVSSHGFAMRDSAGGHSNGGGGGESAPNNQLTLWSYPSLTKMAELTGHTKRVLHMAMSPGGETVVSGAADETLRFWKLFPAAGKPRPRTARRGAKRGGFGMLSIR
jgi:cell division cycle protein 20 (cofactor of APC complex)